MAAAGDRRTHPRHGVSSGDPADGFRRLIRAAGPISVAQFMAESNARYYAGRDPLGNAGDFITAPEISQMFGELIGLWLADMWIAAGRPADAIFVELGPGRGTLAKDALRAAARFGFEPPTHFVEASPTLRAVQARAMPGAIFHEDLCSVPGDAPMLLVANEFLDALPVRQLVRTGDGWRERMVGLADGNLAFVAGSQPMDAAVPDGLAQAAEGALIETCPAAAAIVGEIAARLAARGGAALLIDYGYVRDPVGSTLQAVRAHEKVDPLAHPGAADLTALVDFATVGAVARSHAIRPIGLVGQGDWLRAMGIDARAQALAARAPDQAEALAQAVERLTAPDRMGELFKVAGLAGPGWPGGAGFA